MVRSDRLVPLENSDEVHRGQYLPGGDHCGDGLHFARADYEDDQRDKTTILCQDKVAKMKLAPSEARIAYDLCKETDGRLP